MYSRHEGAENKQMDKKETQKASVLAIMIFSNGISGFQFYVLYKVLRCHQLTECFYSCIYFCGFVGRDEK